MKGNYSKESGNSALQAILGKNFCFLCVLSVCLFSPVRNEEVLKDFEKEIDVLKTVFLEN